MKGSFMYWMRRKLLNTAGVSLGEILTAITLFGILAAIAVPAFTKTLPSLRLDDGARQIATEMQQLRMKAIAQNIPYQMTFATNTYKLQRCNGLCTDDSGNIVLPTGITASASGTPQFQGRGTAAAAVTITVTNGSAQKYVCVKSVGRISIQNTLCS